MGTYTELFISNYPVYSTKSAVDSTVMTIFRESDKVVEVRKLSERNPLMWSNLQDADEEETAVEYSATVAHVKDRLNIMGFTIDKAAYWFDLGIKDKLETYQEWASEGDRDWLIDKIELLKNITFDKYLSAFRVLLEKKIVRWADINELKDDINPITKYILEENEDCLYGFPVNDIRFVLRSIIQLVPDDSLVVQDITDLVEGGYYSINDAVCEESIDGFINYYLSDAKTLVFTEGSTDKRIIEEALNLLYPHLSEYFSFMDFGISRAAGGAPALVQTLKAFIGSGIGNKVVAIFDNDTASKVARKALNGIRIPNNIRVLTYPDIPLAENYPTLGPTGLSNVNINGLAGSIELYLGIDVLTVSGVLTPVHWKGYDNSVNQYQGEILSKTELQNRYFEKCDKCKENPELIKSADWTALECILKSLFFAFEDGMPNIGVDTDAANSAAQVTP